jgi:hypothetical protein
VQATPTLEEIKKSFRKLEYMPRLHRFWLADKKAAQRDDSSKEKKKAVEVDEDLEEIPEIAPKAAETPTQEEVTAIVEEPAGMTTMAPEAQIAKGVSFEVTAEAPDASTEEVKAAKVAPEVEEKRMGLVAPPQFIQIADAGSAAPEVPK